MDVKELFRLDHKVALITGGSRGLGLQIAEAYAEMGANLVITARKAEQLAQAEQRLRAKGAEVRAIAINLAEPESAERLCQQAMLEFGQIDILVNNAGATWGAAAEVHPLEAWDKVMALNVTSLFLLSQAVANASMIAKGYGRIINIASVAGLKANPPSMTGTLAYSTSKGAVVSFTRALASEWAKYGITVNAIAPGYFPTKMTQGTLAYAEETIKALTPLARLGNDDDLKGLAVLLASDASAYMTGQTIAVDGGLSAL